MLQLRELTLLSISFRLIVAIFLGGILGMERGLKNRPAGFRTYILVSLGACMVMMTNQYVFQAFGTGDPVRMGAQVISGIGFLGAGTIIVTKHRQIKGLTTAAGLWASACMGLAVGIGLYEVAILGCLFMFMSFTVLHRLDRYMRNRARVMDAYVEIRKEYNIKDLVLYLNKKNIDINILQMEQDVAMEGSGVSFVVNIYGENRHLTHTEMILALKECKAIKYFEVL